ncbi:hypothetical protein QOT17_004741 [Balamuthia mandrillaris]
MNTIDSLLTWGNLSCWGKDLPMTRLLFEILFFLIRFDLSTASTQMTNSFSCFLRDVTPSSPSPSAVAEYELAQLRLKCSALMGSVANLCLALLEETDSRAKQRDKFLLPCNDSSHPIPQHLLLQNVQHPQVPHLYRVLVESNLRKERVGDETRSVFKRIEEGQRE